MSRRRQAQADAGGGRRHRCGRHRHARPPVHPARTSGARSGWSPRRARPARCCASAARTSWSRRSLRRRSTASTSRCSTCPTRSRRVGPDRRRPWCGGRGQLGCVPDGHRRPARRAGGEPRRRARAAARDHRESELHDAVDDRRRSAPCTASTVCREIVVASYQAASGAGQAGIDTLRSQLVKVAGEPEAGTHAGDLRLVVGDLGPFPAPLAMNVVPWAGSLKEAGWSSEELKVRNESRKILGLPGLKVSATCVRVPVVTTHSLAVHAVFDRPWTSSLPRSCCETRPACSSSTTPRTTVSRRRPTRSVPTPRGSAGYACRWTTRRRSSCSSAATTCARVRHSTPHRSPSSWRPSSRPSARSWAAVSIPSASVRRDDVRAVPCRPRRDHQEATCATCS